MLAATLSLLLFAAPEPDFAAEVEALGKARKLTLTAYRDCDSQFSRVEIFTDAKGVVRKLVNDFGSEDSAHTATHFFDAEGRVRLLKVRVGAVPSAWVKATFVFDASGKIVKQKRTFGGEGPNHYASTPEGYLIATPKEWIARHGCPAP